MTSYKLTRISGNKKTGPIPVSITSRSTCPDACPLKAGGGCYAEGWPLRKHWNDVDTRGSDLDQFCREVRALPKGQLWRHNQAGDLPGESNRVDASALGQLVEANRGRAGFTYTHKPLSRLDERAAVWKANQEGFTINLSANNLHHADTLASYECGPVVAIVPTDHPKHSTTPAGRTVVLCPATQRDDVSCATCGLCAKPNRKAIVAFPAHGNARRKAERVSLNVIQ